MGGGGILKEELRSGRHVRLLERLEWGGILKKG